jgi:hypothetical protein
MHTNLYTEYDENGIQFSKLVSSRCQVITPGTVIKLSERSILPYWRSMELCMMKSIVIVQPIRGWRGGCKLASTHRIIYGVIIVQSLRDLY